MTATVSVLFSEPKIPQFGGADRAGRCDDRFSALQRAENSSIQKAPGRWLTRPSFSALQRAENSSIVRRRPNDGRTTPVSVLFSEPKIPQ